MYAQSSKFSKPNSLPHHHASSSEPPSTYGNEVMIVDQPYVETWRPYIGTSPSRTPSLMTKTGLTIWNQLDYPFGKNFIFLLYLTT